MLRRSSAMLVVSAALGCAVGWWMGRSAGHADRLQPLAADLDLTAGPVPQPEVRDAPLESDRTERVAEPSESATPTEDSHGSAAPDSAAASDGVVYESGAKFPSPRGTNLVRLRQPDGSVVEIELKPSAAPTDPNAYPPPGSIQEGRQLLVFHPSGAVAEVGDFVEGKKVGQWTYMREAGSVALEGEYVDGMSEGLWRSWHDNGSLASEAWTRRGQFHGECRFWNAAGALDETRSGVYENGVRTSSL
jgi:hypothetical protein